MKKVISFVAALLALTGLKAQTVDVKKETTAPKPVPHVASGDTIKSTKITQAKNTQAPGFKFDNNKPATITPFKKENKAPLKATEKTFKSGK